MSIRATAQAQTMSPRPAPVARGSRLELLQGEGHPARANEPRAQLRAAVRERLLQGLTDIQSRLAQFLRTPGRPGSVTLSLVLSESSITYELWKEPALVPECRARLAQTLGVAPETEEASLLRGLMAEVHQAFVEFQASAPGRDARKQYEAVLQGYTAANVLPIVPGHDSGPMLAELARLGLPHERDFSRSLLVDPLLLAVGLGPEEGSESQVMVAGLSVSQLGTLVAQVRRLNPRLTNRQVGQLLMRAATDRKSANRKSLGPAEVEQVRERASQLLRLQVVELLFV
ncbi:hypothetical protein [Archangium sp.]|uniref:hypothetical protein n=1 Tax=Archangium sp. TaxID=1872627 RepID=UPI00389AA576